MDNAMLDWLADLTDTLEIWIEKGLYMTRGELILARVHMGMIVEFWLRFFYCAYYEDYCSDPIIGYVKKAKRQLEPEDETSFSQLLNYSIGKLWPDKNDSMYQWVNKARDSRNAAHPFQYHEIGSNAEFLSDIEMLYTLVESIANRLPPLEDCIYDYS